MVLYSSSSKLPRISAAAIKFAVDFSVKPTTSNNLVEVTKFWELNLPWKPNSLVIELKVFNMAVVVTFISPEADAAFASSTLKALASPLLKAKFRWISTNSLSAWPKALNISRAIKGLNAALIVDLSALNPSLVGFKRFGFAASFNLSTSSLEINLPVFLSLNLLTPPSNSILFKASREDLANCSSISLALAASLAAPAAASNPGANLPKPGIALATSLRLPYIFTPKLLLIFSWKLWHLVILD